MSKKFQRVTRSMSKAANTDIIPDERNEMLLCLKDGLTLKSLIDFCDHEKNKTKKIIKKRQNVNDTITNLLQVLDQLHELNEIVGLDDIKNTVSEHVLYMAQNLTSETDMNHIQICGPPGIGKTTLAVLLGRIYANLGYLEYGNVITVTRADLIGEHLGSTSIKTEEMLQACRGNVMFIDEVYSFGCADKRDSFSKECLDCINMYLSTYREDMLCIIAGYEEDIKDCVFSVNKGLERRFPWKYVLQQYTSEQLKDIFILQIKQNDWNVDENDEKTKSMIISIFNDTNKHYFEYSGGDTEILFMRCKIAHSSRLFANETCERKTLNSHDLRRGFDMFVQFKKKTINKTKEHISMMYC